MFVCRHGILVRWVVIMLYSREVDDTLVIYDTPIIRVSRNVAPRACVLPVRGFIPSRTFGYLQSLGPGDLAIHLESDQGAVSPFSVHYTLYQVTSSGALLRIGVCGTALGDSSGGYYVVGRAGELGQPGLWVIRWEVRLTHHSMPQYVQQQFTVTSESTLASSRRSCRNRIQGW